MRMAFFVAAYVVPILAAAYWGWLWTLVNSISVRQRYLAAGLAAIPFAAGVLILYRAFTFPEEGLIVEAVAVAFVALLVGPPMILVGVSGGVVALLPVNKWRARIVPPVLLVWLLIPVLGVISYAAWMFVTDPIGALRDALQGTVG